MTQKLSHASVLQLFRHIRRRTSCLGYDISVPDYFSVFDVPKMSN
jgi:hypothetical protein